jgi:hypothetical protein
MAQTHSKRFGIRRSLPPSVGGRERAGFNPIGILRPDGPPWAVESSSSFGHRLLHQFADDARIPKANEDTVDSSISTMDPTVVSVLKFLSDDRTGGRAPGRGNIQPVKDRGQSLAPCGHVGQAASGLLRRSQFDLEGNLVWLGRGRPAPEPSRFRSSILNSYLQSSQVGIHPRGDGHLDGLEV